MKKMKKILTATLALSCIAMVGAGVSTFKASAATSVVPTTTFAMKEGASIRTAAPTGIRFTANIGTDVYNAVAADENKNFGMFIIPDSYMDDYLTVTAPDDDNTYDGKYYEYFKTEKKMIDFTYTAEQVKQQDGYYQLLGANTNILFNNLNRKFIGTELDKEYQDHVMARQEYSI